MNTGHLPYLCIAGSGSLLLVVTEKYQIFVWELDANSSFFTAKQLIIPGTWAQVLPEGGSLLPSSTNPYFSVHAVFSINSGVSPVENFSLFRLKYSSLSAEKQVWRYIQLLGFIDIMLAGTGRLRQSGWVSSWVHHMYVLLLIFGLEQHPSGLHKIWCSHWFTTDR